VAAAALATCSSGADDSLVSATIPAELTSAHNHDPPKIVVVVVIGCRLGPFATKHLRSSSIDHPAEEGETRYLGPSISQIG
jgi:hypothetical protein